MSTSTMVRVPFPVQPSNPFLPREIGYQARHTYPSLRCTPGSRLDTTPTNVHPLFTPWQLETPTSHTSILDHPPGGLLETLDQFQIWMEVAQHLSSNTFTLTVKRRLRDQHSLPGWEWKEERLWYEGRIYVPEPLHLQLICNHHDHPTVGHFGHHKTINLICWSCHWLGLTWIAKQYIRSCTECACSKANWHKLYGFLKQLPIPPNHGNPFQWILLSNSWHQRDTWQY